MHCIQNYEVMQIEIKKKTPQF